MCFGTKKRSWGIWLSSHRQSSPLGSSHFRKGWRRLHILLTRVEEEEEWCLLLAQGKAVPWLEDLGCLSDYPGVPGALVLLRSLRTIVVHSEGKDIPHQRKCDVCRAHPHGTAVMWGERRHSVLPPLNLTPPRLTLSKVIGALGHLCLWHWSEGLSGAGLSLGWTALWCMLARASLPCPLHRPYGDVRGTAGEIWCLSANWSIFSWKLSQTLHQSLLVLAKMVFHSLGTSLRACRQCLLKCVLFVQHILIPHSLDLYQTDPCKRLALVWNFWTMFCCCVI